MQALLTLERPAADGSKEFDAIRDNLTRRFMAEGNDDPKLVIAPDYIARLEKLAETGGSPPTRYCSAGTSFAATTMPMPRSGSALPEPSKIRRPLRRDWRWR